MKYIFTFTLSFLLLVSALSATDPVAKITFSNSREETGIQFVVSTNPSAEAYSEQTIKGQLDCRYIPSGKYGYFRVDDGLIITTDAKLIFNITYFDSGNEKFSFQYNSLTSNYKSVSITETNSNSWINTTIGVVDAAFNNLQNNQADFRFSGEVFLRQIAVSKGEPDPTKEAVPVTSGSNYSEFKGKSVAGYQAWFTANSTNSGWVHWSGNTMPNAGNFSFEIYPDMTDYPTEMRKQSGFGKFWEW